MHAKPVRKRLPGSVVEDQAAIGRNAGVVAPMGDEPLDRLTDLVRCLGREDDGPAGGGNIGRVDVVGKAVKGPLQRLPEPPEQPDILGRWRPARGAPCGLLLGHRRHRGEPGQGVDAVEMKPTVLVCGFQVHDVRHLALRGFYPRRE